MSKKPLIWIIITLLAEMVLVAVFAPPSWMQKAIQVELEWVDDTYSTDTKEWIEHKTEQIHSSIVIETGAKEWVQWMFLPEKTESHKKGAMDKLGERFWFPFLESRGQTLDEMIKITIMRIVSISVWLPLILFCLVGCFTDGWMERNIKRHTFKYPSPFLYRYGARSSILGLFVILFCIMTPLPMPPALLPSLIMLSIAITGFSVIANLPKRL